MAMTIRARFDGKVIVPEEPLELPVDQELEVELKPVVRKTLPDVREERKVALERLAARAIPGLKILDEALRREALYEDGL